MTDVHLDDSYSLAGSPLPYAMRGLQMGEVYFKIRSAIERYGRDRGLNPAIDYAIGNMENETICFILDGPFWSIFYSERGGRSDPALFRSLYDAFSFFLVKIYREVDVPIL